MIGEQGRQYDINDLYRQAFGHVRPPYPVLLAQSRQLGYSPVGLVRSLRGAFSFSSKLGTELSMPTKLNDFQLPNEPTIRITGSKNIKQTKLTRLDAIGQINRQNVLEEINLNNFRVMIRGIIINEDDPTDYPEDAIRGLRDAVLASGSVRIENALCSLWGISMLAIEDFDMHELKGDISAQSYTLIGFSDEVVDLEVIEPETV